MKAPSAAQPAVDLTKTGKFDLTFNALDANSIPAPSVSRTVYVVGNDGASPIVTPRRGTVKSQGVWETTLDANARTLLQVKVENDTEADQIFSILMGDSVDPRRNFIQTNALNVRNLDV